jgi:hypothetical protein
MQKNRMKGHGDVPSFIYIWGNLDDFFKLPVPQILNFSFSGKVQVQR